ncbi:acyl--CoA ligase [Sporobolomyces salmoneus]|uniref:acyl--CoA ligase n=1 Tax=Sporobolomyces salmoneus TaxID=183962 RepID=UPI003170782D
MIFESPWPKVDLPECSVWEKVWSNPRNKSDKDVAVIDGPTGRTLTRGQLRELSQRTAHGFRRTGLKPGSVVLLFSPNTFYYHMIVLATQCAGVVFSGANAAYVPDEFAHQVEDSGAQLLLVHPSCLGVALAATKELGWSEKRQVENIILAVRKDEAQGADERFLTLDSIIDDELLQPHKITSPKTTVAYLGYSSGTSGKAKGVRTSAYNMTSVLSMLEPLNRDITDKDVSMVVLPLNHIYGLTKLLHWPVLIGTPVVVMPKYELKQLCHLLEKYRATILMLVPPIALHMARDPLATKYDLSNLRLVISGAAPLGPELEKELANRLPGCDVIQAYGLTESSPTTHVALSPYNKRGSIGPNLPMLRGRIVDVETNKDLGPNQSGELLLSAPSIMLGYHNKPEATAETLVTDEKGDIWLRTGDIGHYDDDGCCFITDRLKSLIKVKGLQVAPADLEASLLTSPLVEDVAVTGVYAEEEVTEFPRAFIVPVDKNCLRPGRQSDQLAQQLRKFIEGKHAHYKWIRGGFVFIEAVPKSPSGKILRRLMGDVKGHLVQPYPAKIKAKL